MTKRRSQVLKDNTLMIVDKLVKSESLWVYYEDKPTKINGHEMTIVGYDLATKKDILKAINK
jgi:hypothetical protein